MKIAYFGNGRRGVVCLKTAIAQGWDVKILVANPGSHTAEKPNPLCQLADEHGIPALIPARINAPESISELSKYGVDLIVMAGYSPILKREILALPPLGSINLHGGKLPDYRGGSPINWQIINGEKEGGCVIHCVNESIDTGDILVQEFYPIGSDETAGEVIERTLEIFPRLLIGAIADIENGTARPRPQGQAVGSYYCQRHPEDGRIHWRDMTARQVHNLVRGLHGPDLPGAFTFLDGTKVILWKTELPEEIVKGVPGRVAFRKQGGIFGIAKDRGLVISEVRLDSDPTIVPATDVLRPGLSLQ